VAALGAPLHKAAARGARRRTECLQSEQSALLVFNLILIIHRVAGGSIRRNYPPERTSSDAV